MKANVAIEVKPLITRNGLSIAAIHALLPQFTLKQVKTAVYTMVYTREVVREGGRRSSVYRLRKPNAQSDAPAPSPLIHGFKPLQRNVFANWEMCQRAPFDAARDLRALVR